MTGNVYSTYELAREKAHEKVKEIEQDVFICSCSYRSGKEFLLKTRSEVIGDYLHIVELPFRHKFRTKQNADREASKFASKKGRPVYVRQKRKIISGYDFIDYYYLTYIEPCST